MITYDSARGQWVKYMYSYILAIMCNMFISETLPARYFNSFSLDDIPVVNTYMYIYMYIYIYNWYAIYTDQMLIWDRII